MDFGQMNIGQPSNAQLAALQSQLQGLVNNFEQINKYRGGDVTDKTRPMDVLTVAGDDGARKFLQGMPNNSSGIVFNDGDDMYFYILKKDANGVPAPIKKCPFTIEDIMDTTDVTITKKDIDDIRSEMSEIKSLLSRQKFPDAQQRQKYQGKPGGGQNEPAS